MQVAFREIKKGMVLEFSPTTDDRAFVEEMAWQEVAGVRLNKAVEFVSQQSNLVTLTALALTKEVLRWLTSGFLRCARSVPDPCLFPRLCDFVPPELSRVTVALQYFSGLLQGNGRRLTLLLEVVGHTSLDSWLAADYDQAVMFHRLLLTAASWTYRRHCHLLQSWPWRLAALPDLRVPLCERRRLAHSFMHTPPCCLDPYFARRLQAQVGDVEELFSAEWLSCLLAWASRVQCSTAAVEFLHQHNRQRAHPQMSWANFSALFVNAEAQARTTASRRLAMLVEARRSGGEPHPAPGEPALEAPIHEGGNPRPRLRRWTRAKTALELYRLDAIKRDKALGIRANPVSSEAWQRYRSEFAALPCATRASYEERARLSSSAALTVRRQLKDQPEPPGCSGTTTTPCGALAVTPSPASAAVLCQACAVCASQGCPDVLHPPSPPAYIDESGGLTSSCGAPQQRPLDAVEFDAFFRRRPGRYTAVACAQQYEQEVGSDAHFPKSVIYPKPCGPVCSTTSPPAVLHLHRLLIDRLATLAASLGTASQVANQDVLLRFEAYSEGGLLGVLWAGMPTVSARAGALAPRQNLVEYIPLGGSTEASGTTLHLKLRAFVRPTHSSGTRADPKFRSPFNEVLSHTCGALAHFTEEEWGEHVCRCFPGASLKTLAAIVKLCVLR